jgi:hypothetical protein
MSNGLFEHRGPVGQVAVAPWVLAHEAVLEVAKERARLERREGTRLLRAHRERVHRHLGYGAFAEYTDRHLGYCHRTTADKLRTAEALEQLPELARAQQEGRLHASAVRELARSFDMAGPGSTHFECAGPSRNSARSAPQTPGPSPRTRNGCRRGLGRGWGGTDGMPPLAAAAASVSPLLRCSCAAHCAPRGGDGNSAARARQLPGGRFRV